MKQIYKYYAFISYSSKDIKWGKRLHNKLTQFRLPSVLGSDKENRHPIRPVFFAPYDIQPGELTDELKERLRASKYLIVICSPNSAKSDWVGKEIKYFCSINKKENVFFFIIEGEPKAKDPEFECYNHIIHEIGFVDPLGVNVNERIYSFPFSSWNEERAYIQLITKLLGVDFDVLWDHHKRLLKQKVVAVISFILLLTCLIFSIIFYFHPIDAKLTFAENTPPNKDLPPISNLEVDLKIGSYSNKYRISELNNTVEIKDIPRSYIGKNVKICIKGDNCLNLDTVFAFTKSNKVFLSRNIRFYGHIEFTLLDRETHCPIPNVSLSIDDTETCSDKNGNVICDISVTKQKKEYVLTSQELQFENTILQPPFESNSRIVLAETNRK